ncbi:T9SS type A sorting domain-containing protein [Flavobacterium zepuense]|uniref:T9SS type A sorting domain-containing protein n=1 Tax=Flavobacterium zepuense TaxID=2593302 RepID=A0A552UWH6_9FLAO|nr:two-component regulator propeller domain-containing protein [Flavobacterium zepuense]TRW22591.1 T9SS type A sorting domain-containing protein [Flavobacterium zepuense]
MKQFLPLYFLLLSITCFAQGDQTWGSYFSYYNTVDIAQSSSKVFAASENAIFSQNTINGELKTITSVDGLKAENITTIYHSTDFNRTLIGNSNGLLLVINPDNKIVSKIDIVQEATVASNKKKINHIDEYNGIAYISCDFGVALLNLATLEFGDTYYLGPNGAEIPVIQTAVYNGFIYACTDGFGIRKAAFGNPNLNDYNQWTQEFGGSWTGILAYADHLFGIDAQGGFFRLINTSPFPFTFLPSGATDLKISNGYMVATCPTKVVVYSELNQVLQITDILDAENTPETFTCASIVGGILYIGTTTKGVFAMDMSILTANNITPNGPLRNAIFSLAKSANNLWAVFGYYNYYYTPEYLSKHGISKYTAEGWESISYPEITTAVGADVLAITDVIVNPTNEKQAYFSSHGSGLLKVVDDVPEILYREGNSPFEHEQVDNTTSVRVDGTAYDSEGNLWVMNSMTKKPLKKLSTNGTSWTSYSFEDFIPTAKLIRENYGQLVIDKNDTKWITGYQIGLIAYNEKLDKRVVVGEEAGLASNYVKSIAIDNNNRLWIGTARGLSVISSIERFVSDEDLTPAPVIFVDEEGNASELMYEQTILDIEVDGANNKWFATGAGAFLVSPDGQKTLFHFTKENSPLPSNTINDMEIDPATGEVFFATDRGMVSYKGTSTAAADDLSKVYVYPNPVRPGFDGDVKISGLVDNANIKITDIEGNLVYETTSEGGTVLWDTRAFGKYKVASGVYMIFIAAEDAVETKVKKVMIIRGN